MSEGILILVTTSGPNNVHYSLLSETMIRCISDYELSESDRKLVEDRLNLNLSLGIRFPPSVEVDQYGRLVTTWFFTHPSDCDWS